MRIAMRSSTTSTARPKWIRSNQLVISVDTKRRSLWLFQECRAGVGAKGQPEEVRVHDFQIREPIKGRWSLRVYGCLMRARIDMNER